jgi:hypothetical protein
MATRRPAISPKEIHRGHAGKEQKEPQRDTYVEKAEFPGDLGPHLRASSYK